MTHADTLITRVLNEGRIRHLMIPDFGITKNAESYADPKIRDRAERFTGGVIEKPTLSTRDIRFGPGRSPNKHLNAVVRHILPSLGQMLADGSGGEKGTRGKGNIEVDPAAPDLGQKRVRLGPRMGGIFKEYDRHLTDLANHIHNRQRQRELNNSEHGGELPDDLDYGDDPRVVKDNVDDQRHDVVDHRGSGVDISQFGEIITGFFSPESTISREGLHPKDRDLNDDGSVDQLKARLDHFYRNGNYFISPDTIKHPPVPEEHHDRILSASKKISIPAGRFQGRRQAGMKRIMRPLQGTYDDLRPTAKKTALRFVRLMDLKKAKKEAGKVA